MMTTAIKTTCIMVGALLLSAAASAQSGSLRPADMSTDDAGMWYAVDKIEARVQTSGARLTDPALEAYVNKVTCKVTGPACSQIRPYVMNDSSFNAAMFPNGMMVVNSGLLLRAENEAQLACVIGHEYGHFNQKHSLEQWRKSKNRANVAMVFSVAASAAGIGGAGLGTQLLSGLFGQSFSREHEREADKIGFDLAQSAGYDARECAKVWKNLVSEQQKSGFEDVRKRVNKDSVFSSHPVPADREQALAGFAASLPPGGDLNTADFKAATAPYLQTWLENELRAGDYDRHVYLFEQLKARGHDAAMLNYYIGEAHRKRRKSGDRDLAYAAYSAASKAAVPPPLVWRALGEHYRIEGKAAEAVSAYNRYLSAASAAPERALIEGYIRELMP